VQAFRNFSVILFSLLLEATPFLLLGVLVSAALSVYVSDDFLMKWFPRRTSLALLYALVVGFVFPVCECGNVPVARRLMAKGVPHGAAITFLLAAPVLNPIAIIVTVAAFPGQPEILWLRLTFTVIISLSVGAVFSLIRKSEVVKESVAVGACAAVAGPPGGEKIDTHGRLNVGGRDEAMLNDHSHDCNECADYAYYRTLPPRQRGIQFLFLVRNEFIEMLRLLVLGAIIAASFRTFVPQALLNKVGVSQVLSVLTLMLLAFIMSLCSNVDAFFAAAFAGTFSPGSLVAFLVFGPMINVKTLVMMTSTFKARALFWLTVIVVLATFMLALLANYVIL
jgi:uncharacterized membrane protein YraQ (UPF0718 family)